MTSLLSHRVQETLPCQVAHTIHRPIGWAACWRTTCLKTSKLGLFYINRSGCQWDMLPHDLPPKSTVYVYFARWREDGTWQSGRRFTGEGADGSRRLRRHAECREHRQSIGEKRRATRWGHGVRWSQEDYWPQASFGGGYAGFALGGGGDQCGDRRRSSSPRCARQLTAETFSTEGDLDGQQVSQPQAPGMGSCRHRSAMVALGGETPRRDKRFRAP